MYNKLKEIAVVILCGGMGTRLRSAVADRPKVLAKIGEKTFLDILIDGLLAAGFENIILSTGYMKEQIRSHFNLQKDFNIYFSEEDEPLGTGGALKKAASLIRSDRFVVLNGDSICNVDFHRFFEFHYKKKAILSMVLVRADSTSDYGNVNVDRENKIMDFKEKTCAGTVECLINAGIYMMEKDIFTHMLKKDKFSLEYDFFPKFVENNNCYGFVTDGKLIDIGTPQRYKDAINLLRR